MAEYSNSAVQTIAPGQAAIFTEAPVPCNRGFVRHRDGSGSFLLSGYIPYGVSGCSCCNRNNGANYLIDFGANIAVPTGETPGEISVAISVDGSQLASSLMIVTPAAVGEYFNISRAINVEVFKNCCETITIVNTSDIPILMQNANIIITRPDLVVTR